jgi:radical SAM protein with 4Fe4S-binding SPASM domain
LIQLAWDLKIPEVQCNYVTMFNQDHFEMSPFFQQERANKAIDAAQAKLDEIRSKADPDEFRYFGVRLPQKFGQPSSGKAEGFCSEPWEHIYVEGQGSVLPCCNWGAHVGNLNKGEELDDIWNGAFYKTMREAISKNEPHPWCGTCWKYRPQSVDSLLGHITNRPDQQKRLLRQLEERGLAKYSDYAAGIEAAEGFMPR